MKVLSLIIILGASVFAEVPKFQREVLLEHEGGEFWNLNGEFLTPTYTDWDQDGDNDLLIGYMHGAGPATSVITGRIMHYDNIGTSADPKFKSMGDLPIQVNGA